MMHTSHPAQWPKTNPPLSQAEEDARHTFMKLWHEALPQQYTAIEHFNHRYPLKSKRSAAERVLEIGAGLGEHLYYEHPDWQEYVCLELRSEMAVVIRERFPSVAVVVGDCQAEIPFQDKYFDRILAIHVLEHLPNLPAALREIARVLRPDGRFSVCIPCEGGALYSFARLISAQRLFRKHFPWLDYQKVVVAQEHLNRPAEIMLELVRFFEVIGQEFFPFRLPFVQTNLVIGLTLQLKVVPRTSPSAKNTDADENVRGMKD